MTCTIISTQNPGLWFSLISLSTFLLVNGVFILKGRQQKASMESLFLVSAAGMLFLAIGIHLFPLSFSELKNASANGYTQHLGEKSIIGALAGVLARFLAIAWMKEKAKLIDNIAVVTLIGLGMLNLGCFLAGCCYGSETTLPWGIQYGEASPAFQGQLAGNLLHWGNSLSMPIHPVQMYLLVACLVAALFAWRMKNRWKAPVSPFLFSLVLYVIARFAVEFFRDPDTNHGAGYMILGLKEIQWILAALLILFSLTLALRERYWKPGIQQKILSTGESLTRSMILLLFLAIIYWKYKGLLEPNEKFMVGCLLFISLSLVSWSMFKLFTVPRHRVAILTVFSLLFILMGQSYIPEKAGDKITYTEIGGGVQFSKFYNNVTTGITSSGTDCNGNPSSTYTYKGVKYNSTVGGISFAKTENLDKYKRLKYGLNLYFGSDIGKGIDTSLSLTHSIIAGMPYISYNTHNFGIMGGLHLGQFHFADITTEESDAAHGLIGNDVKNLNIYPSLNLRLGPYDILYFEGFLADHFPSSSPVLLSGISIGSGLGRVDGTSLNVGVTTNSGLFLKATLPIQKNYFVEAFYGGKSNSSSDPYSSRSNFSLGFHYRFNYKKVSDNGKMKNNL